MEILLKVEDLARTLNVPKSSIYRWTSEGKIPYLRVGALLRFNLKDVFRALKHGDEWQMFYVIQKWRRELENPQEDNNRSSN